MNSVRLIALLAWVAAFSGCIGTPKQELYRMGARIEPLGPSPVRISLRGKRVSEADLMIANALCSNHSKEYSELRELDLSRSKVSDAALNYIARNADELASLQVLNLSEVEVSSQTITELQKALPQCKIVY